MSSYKSHLKLKTYLRFVSLCRASPLLTVTASRAALPPSKPRTQLNNEKQNIQTAGKCH